MFPSQAGTHLIAASKRYGSKKTRPSRAAGYAKVSLGGRALTPLNSLPRDKYIAAFCPSCRESFRECKGP